MPTPPVRTELPVLAAAIVTLRARHDAGDLRAEPVVAGLSLLRAAARAYAVGTYPPSEARCLSQAVLRLVAATA